nr:NusG domain II-containing protein [Chitinivorax tropicus]
MSLIKPGDWLVGCLAVLFCVSVARWSWWQGTATAVVVRARGETVARLALDQPHTLSVQGPLGQTVIEIAPGRARISQDPSPRQYCVLRGWLTRVGEMALCLPNQTSIELTGLAHRYDSLNY